MEESSRPPLAGKDHPPAEISDVKPTLDDSDRMYHHHPNEAGTTEFGFAPEAADAAADLAGDLGTQFLEGATRGEDMSSRVLFMEDRDDNEVPFLIEDELSLSDTMPLESDMDDPAVSHLDEEENEFEEHASRRKLR